MLFLYFLVLVGVLVLIFKTFKFFKSKVFKTEKAQRIFDFCAFLALSALYLLYEVYFGAGKKADIRVDLIVILPALMVLISYFAAFATPKRAIRVVIGIVWTLALFVSASVLFFGVTYGR